LAIYICKCGFSFESTSNPERCPDCGGLNVRNANSAEAAEHRRNSEEADHAYSQEKNEDCV
jgi:hypothetical protein